MLFEVRKTIGICLARIVPSSGIETWYSERISSISASVSSSTRSTSSMSSTTGSVAEIASSSGRVSRNSSAKMSSSRWCHSSAPVALGSAGLDAQQLLAVVPLVEGLRLVESLVALQSDEPRADRVGDRLGERRLARAGRSFDEHRLGQPIGEEGDRGDGVVAQVVVLGQAASAPRRASRSAPAARSSSPRRLASSSRGSRALIESVPLLARPT